MKLLGNRILCKPLPKREVSTGGIVLPTTYDDNEKTFEVIAVGTGKRLKDGTRRLSEIQVGDRILHNQYHGAVFIFDNGDRILDAASVEMVWR